MGLLLKLRTWERSTAFYQKERPEILHSLKSIKVDLEQ